MSLVDLYRQACTTPSDIYEHLPTLADLVIERDCQSVLELGTRTGCSTVAFLYALQQTGGNLTSVDLDTRPNIGTYEHWRFIQGNDLDPDVLRQLDPADVVFIDTSHLYDHTVAELNIYVNLVRRPGLMVLHDTELEQPIGAPARPRFPVKKAVTEFCETEGYAWTNNPRCWGLAVIEVV